MTARSTVSLRGYSPGSPDDRRRGLLGWITLTVDDLFHLDGVAVRRTRAGDLALSFPERRDSAGRRHSLIRPVDDAARLAIEAAVLAALEQKGVTL